MGKNRRRDLEVERARSTTLASAVFAGTLCLALGGFLGYMLHSKTVAGTPAAAPAEEASLTAAEARLRGLLLTDPRNRQALVQLGNLQYDRGMFRDAVEHYGRALELDARNVDVRTDRGTSYWNIGEPDLALAEFRKSLEVDPSHAQTLFNLGVVSLDGKNDAVAARAAWKKLLEKHPSYPERAKVESLLASLPVQSADQSVRSIEALLERMKRP